MSTSEFEGLSEDEIAQYIAVGCKNLGNDTAQREIEGVSKVFDEISNSTFPTVPTIQYVSGINKDNELWVNAHQEIVNASQNGLFVQLECGHYVHKYESERIADDIKDFIGK